MKKYALPNELYRQTVWFIKQYEQKQTEYKTVFWSYVEADGQPRATMPGNPTQSRGMRAARLSQDLKAVEDALQRLPEYYREPVLQNTVNKKPWPCLADRKTYCKYKRMFVWWVARNMEWI